MRAKIQKNDRRVCGKILGASLDGATLLMEISYPDENCRKSVACYSRNLGGVIEANKWETDSDAKESLSVMKLGSLCHSMSRPANLTDEDS